MKPLFESLICVQTTFLTELKFLCLTSILTIECSWRQVAKADVSCALLHSRRNSSLLHTKLSARDHEIGQAKERVKPCRILGEPTVANLHQTQQVLDNVKKDVRLRPEYSLCSCSIFSRIRTNGASGSARRFPGRIATCQLGLFC